MDKFKLVVDILSSTAAMIAIFTVLVAWISSKKKPLKVKRVVIHQSSDSSMYILEIENNKPYYVEVKATQCFTKKHYKVEQVNNCFPTIRGTYSLTDSVFLADKIHSIQPNGCTDLRFNKGKNLNDVKELIFLMDTSHGFHSLKCKNITLVNMGTQVFGMEAVEEYSSWLLAVKCYVKLSAKRLGNMLKRKITRG
tara:strand:- start:11409 stop:11993 length:585 start_codon:yes stop_codon:yes gene_type:complete